jgi:hypothetical protein
MTAVNEKVIAKLAKIKAHQKSAESIGSEAEAMHFARMLNELLMKHNLEMTDIEWEAEVKEEPVERFTVGGGTVWSKDYKRQTYKDYPDVEIKNRRCAWSEDLARMISRTYGCDWLLRPGSSVITFVGRKSNVAIVEYMYITMLRTVESLSWKEYKTARNKTKWAQIKHLPKAQQSTAFVDYGELEGYRASWIEGFVGRVSEMLWDVRKAEKADTSASTALVRINTDAIATRAYMNSLNSKSAKALRGNSGYNAAGRAAGCAKANEVGLTARGMKGGAGAVKHLK